MYNLNIIIQQTRSPAKVQNITELQSQETLATTPLIFYYS